nr:non-ribosomal peptide synthetase [Pseudomonas caspiana]
MNSNLAPLYRFCASTAQRRLWQLHQRDPSSAAGHCTTVMRLQGALNRQALERCLDNVVQRHEALCTRFSWEDGDLVQWVCDGLQIPLAFVDLSALADHALARGMQLAHQDAIEPFDLTHDTLLRPRLIRLDEDDHLLVLTAHPIIADRRSIGILCEEWSQTYIAFGPDDVPLLPEMPVQYADFSVWQREWTESDPVRALLSRSSVAFKTRPWTLELPRVGAAPPAPHRQGSAVKWHAEPSTLEHIEHLAARQRTTVEIALLAVFNIVLYRYGQQDEICLGYPGMNRRHDETQGVIGCFANTLVMRTNLRSGISLEDAVSLTRDARAHADEHLDIDFERLLDALTKEGEGLSVEQLPVMFKLHQPPSLALTGLAVTPVHLETQAVDCDLRLVVHASQTHLEGRFEYDTHLFDTVTIERLAQHFQTVLKALALSPQKFIDQLPLAPTHCGSLSLTLDTTEFNPAQQLPVFRRFEQQVQRTPEAVALVFEQQAWSYTALNRQANQLAWHLRAQGVGPETIVALLVERGPRLISSLLAILKAGGAYLPLDSMYPAQRIETMLDDAGVALIITCEALRENLPDSKLPILCLDQDREELAHLPEINPAIEVDHRNLAYCLFTSGSTGRPKGVQIEHRALSNLLGAMQAAPGLTPSDVWLCVTSAAFDIFAVEVYLPLISGARILLASKEDAGDPVSLARLATEHGATVLQATPATWRMLIDSQVRLTLHTAMSGGEAMDDTLANGMRTLARNVWNLYGPTETTIYSSRAHIGVEQLPTLGGPIENTRLYVLDRHFNPVPVGCTGEIYIAGDGLARGYVNRPDLTADRFLPDPFGPSGSRMYRTGDLARQLLNSNLVYLDRVDFQVKIRGLRIELGEIEAALRCCPSVRQAIVTAHGNDPATRKLVGYVVARPGQTLERDALMLELQKTIPQYMVPSVWVFLEQLPLNVSGKIDRKRLPAPTTSQMAGQKAFVAANSAIHIRLAGIWAEILQIDRVSLHDNFFALGGNSMLAIRCLVRINREFDKPLSLRTFFEHQTVDALARYLEEQTDLTLGQDVRLTTWFTDPALPDVYGFSGCGMHGAAFFQLARALAPIGNFHAMEPFEPSSDDSWLSVQDLANRYAKAISARANDEPITLVGHSFGGSIALETARLLEQESKAVHLILLDATLIDPRVLEKEAGVFAGPDRLPEWLDSSHEDLGSEAVRRQLLASAHTLYLQHCRTFAAYVPSGTFCGPVTVFLAEDAILQQKLRPGFQRVCRQLLLQPPVWHKVPGDHMTMLTTPQVEVLGTVIGNELRRDPLSLAANAAPASVELGSA